MDAAARRPRSYRRRFESFARFADEKTRLSLLVKIVVDVPLTVYLGRSVIA